MGTYYFKADQKVTGWQTTSFEVEADTQQEAEEKIKDLLRQGEKILTNEDESILVTDDNFFYEDTKQLKVFENFGNATVRIKDEKDNDLFDNVDVPDESINDDFDVRFTQVMDDNTYNPFFIALAVRMYTEYMNELSDEEIVKYHVFFPDPKAIRNRIYKINEIINRQ